MSDDTIQMEVPFPDYEGFKHWAENEYSDNRCSGVHINKNPRTGGMITIESGKHPSYSRFVKDVRPRLHENGFVISKTERDRWDYTDSRPTAHVITAIPMVWAVCYANGDICRRGACGAITHEEYCDKCRQFFDEDTEHSERPRIINP